MDPFTVAKLGDVTIQRVPSKPDDSKVNIVEEPAKEVIPNSITSHIQLPKLPPSINITLKSTPAISSNTSDNPSKNSKDVRQVQIDANKCVTLSREVELRRRDNPVINEIKIANSTSFDSNSPNEDAKDVSKDTSNENHATSDADVNDYDDVEKSAANVSSQSEYEYEDESDELQDADPDHKMESENVPDPKIKSHLNESDVNPDEISERLEDDADPTEAENAEDEEYREDECVPDGIPDDLPAIPIEALATEITGDIICKEEQYSDKELASNESDDADDEREKDGEAGEAADQTKKKKRKPKSGDESDENSNEMKKQKTSPEEESADSETNSKTASEIKIGSMRRNIREVMDETKLEEATLAAQRQEMERLRRVQEQQKIIRDVQRQIAQNRQNSKMQARVLSLLQKGTTSLIKKEEEDEYEEEMIEDNKPNTVVVKLSTGSGPPQIVNKKVLDMLKKQNSAAEQEEEEVAKEKLVVLSKNLDKPQMMTASVSIAPVKPESKPVEPIFEKEEEEEEKPKDVVMISSSSDEEDDCIVISEEEEESEPDEDPTNSGMHTNDLYNVPDEQGRVLINVGHPNSEKDVFLAPQIARIIKPHQIGGVRFLFDNIVESLDRYNTSEGFGCILAHSMGLGKTLQVVSFCDVFLRYTEGKTVLCIMPINTLQNWVAEFNMWLPTDPEGSPLKEQGEVLTRSFPLFVLNDNQKTLTARANVIQNWHKEGGVLLIGYELYRQLSLKKPPKTRNRSKRKTEAEEDLEDEKCKNLLETMYNALVKPGPDLVICDEGHRIKNSHASISQALKQIRSKRRVVLTGYPLQNNLLEYWCMVDFVRPNYLGTKTEFSNMFERPIQNGQCIDSTPQDIKLMRYRAHVLHSLLEGFVQRRSHSVLQQTLPSKYEYVLLLRMTSFQRGLYNTFMNEVVRTKAVPNPLKAFAVCCKIWNHPDILYNFLKKRAGDEELDLDLEETAAGIGTPASGPSTPMTPSTPPHQGINKRSRSGRGGKAGKEAKLPRKNARANTPQTSTKTPLIAAVPPNTASNTKPTSPEESVPATNSQSATPFNSYGNQFQNFNQQNENFADYSQSSGTNQNYNNFGTEYGNASNASSNQDFNSSNYQQNFGDSNFYQAEYGQNNYWNNEGGNFYNSNTSTRTPTDEYYKQNSATNSPYNLNEYNTNVENTATNYGNSNYNFDMNSQQMGYANDFNIKQESSSMSHYNMGENNALSGGEMLTDSSNDMSNQMFADTSNSDMNYRNDNAGMCEQPHFGNQNVNLGRNNVGMMSGMNERMMVNDNSNKNRRGGVSNMFNASQARNIQGQMNNARFPSDDNGPMNFNVFGTQAPKPSPRMPAARGRPSIRSGGVGRPRKNANNRTGASKEQNEEFKFKPGLPGGAPVMKQGMPDAGQNFQNMVPAQMEGHLMGSQLSADDLNNVFSQGQMGASFLDSLRSEELWNPSVPDQNTLFEQNYMYDDGTQMLPQNANFIGNEAPSLLGGVRAPRGMLNEVQPADNLFSGVQSAYSGGVAPLDPNLFSMENFNYLNELQNANYQMSSHNNFMGLLESESNLGIGQNTAVADDIMKATQFAATQLPAANYMDPVMQYQNTNLLNPNVANVAAGTSAMNANKNVSFEPTRSNDPLPSLPVEKDVSQSIMGLARRGQITLKVVDKKVDTRNEPNEQNNMAEQSRASFQSAQNRLPSIDIFNTSQNFVSTARLNQDAVGFTPMRQFGYTDSQTNTGVVAATNQSGQRGWENFDVNATTDFNAQTAMNEKPQQFGFNQNQIMQSSTSIGNVQESSPQYNDPRCGTPSAQGKQELHKEGNQLQMQYGTENRTVFKKESYPNPVTSQDSILKDDQHRISSPKEKAKLNEDKSNKTIFPPLPSKAEPSKNAAGKTQTKMNPPSVVSAKIPEKKQPLRRNTTSSRAETAKQYQPKNEPFSNHSKQSQSETQFSPGLTISPSLPANPTILKTEIRERPIEDVEIPEVKMPAPELPAPKSVKEEPGIPYEWTNEFFKDYEPGKIEASAKTLIFFCMLEEIIRVGDRLLLFSQSLFTLDLLEDFLQMFNIPGTEEKWARNKSYFRLDGSTTALEREKLINEFNSNPSVHLFLVSTRAGSLGINLVGANRVVVFDASWNPCHDTQAVCRVYRYGQRKSCYVYRFVMDNCLEKKIYDRQINKQGMADRVVDECNPDAHLTIKDVSNLCWDSEDTSDGKKDFRHLKDKYNDLVIQTIIEKFSSSLSKEPFQHESLLVDRKDNKLSQAEKRMAKRSYELEKQASLRPSYGFYNNPQSMQNRMGKPMASVRPMQADSSNVQREGPRRWIPAEVWQKQGMSAQEMTLPLDVEIPTNASDSRIVLKAKEKVMVLKSPKGIYMQLENGKIIAIKTAVKTGLGQSKPGGLSRSMGMGQGGLRMLPRPSPDRPLSSLGGRRDVTVSPIRNRFAPNMRSNPNIPMSAMRPGFSRGPRPGQPIVRTFPLPRPQGSQPSQSRPLRPPIPAVKQIFGPNSSVTISLANKKKMESEAEQTNASEIHYEDYNSINRLKDMQNMPLGRRSEEEGTKGESTDRHQFSDTDGITSRMLDSSNSLPSSRAAESSNPSRGLDQTSKISAQGGTRQTETAVSKLSPKFSDVIPESLRFKKDINLTPVRPAASKNETAKSTSNTPKSLPPKMTASASFQAQQQQHYQTQQQRLNPANLKAPPSSATSANTKGKIMKSDSNAAAGRAKLPVPESILAKKDVQVSVKTPELPAKSNSQHSISIFPINKKPEEDQTGTESTQNQQTASFDGDYQSKNASYFSDYQKPYRDYYQDEKSSPETSSRFANNPYEAFKSNYSSNFAQQQQQPQRQQEYPSQSQHSYGSTQYSSTPYANQDFGSGSYGADNSQYGNSMFSNQSHSAASSASFNSYDQYGWQNYPPKTGASQHSPGQPPPPPQPPPQ